VEQEALELHRQLQVQALPMREVVVVDWKVRERKALAVRGAVVLAIMVLAQTAQVELPTLAVVVAVLEKELAVHRLLLETAVLV
jgi:hypothetical protein